MLKPLIHVIRKIHYFSQFYYQVNKTLPYYAIAVNMVRDKMYYTALNLTVNNGWDGFSWIYND